jgi:tetratricopeptide (TPR) repeat protein
VVCIKENLAEEAYRSLKKAVTLDPDNAYYNYAFGSVAVQRQDASEAIPYLKKYVELKPDDSKGKLALGAAYFYSHSDELAQKQFEPLVDVPEVAPVADYFLGRVANQQGRYADAIQELHQALKANPSFADAYAELGLLHLKQKQYPEAEKALRQALDLDPDSYTGNLNLMILYQRTRDPRADAQAKRFEEVRAQRAERAKELLRTIVVQP